MRVEEELIYGEKMMREVREMNGVKQGTKDMRIDKMAKRKRLMEEYQLSTMVAREKRVALQNAEAQEKNAANLAALITQPKKKKIIGAKQP